MRLLSLNNFLSVTADISYNVVRLTVIAALILVMGPALRNTLRTAEECTTVQQRKRTTSTRCGRSIMLKLLALPIISIILHVIWHVSGANFNTVDGSKPNQLQ